ncbi:MAG: hypothetical protein RR444_10355 [Oscillospiraceae bacterium]
MPIDLSGYLALIPYTLPQSPNLSYQKSMQIGSTHPACAVILNRIAR